MANPLRSLFNAQKSDGPESQLVKVLVSLNTSADDACLESLKKIGLCVQSVTGNKLTGEISSQLMPGLERHETVSDVERSVTLRPTDAQSDDS